MRGAARRRRLTRLLAARSSPDAVEVGLADGVLTEQVLARLDLDRRTAFVLTQLLGFDYATAAAICGCPIGTIRSRVACAREQLVADMGPPTGARPAFGETIGHMATSGRDETDRSDGALPRDQTAPTGARGEGAEPATPPVP